MKKLLFIMLILTAGTFALTGCKKSGENPPSVSEGQIVGKWSYVKIVEDGDTDTFTDGEYIEFKADGTAYDSMDDDNAQWSVSGNNLTVISNNQTNVAQIQKLTKTEMVLYYKGADYTSTAYFKK
jgi:hypothetical protein